MATDYLAGEEGEYFIAVEDVRSLSTEAKVAFDDVIIDKAKAGFNIVTHTTEDGRFFIIRWKRSN